MAQEPPIVAPPTPPIAGNAGSERPILKTVLTIIEGIVLGVLAFAFGNYYLQLSRSEEVRWTRAEIECLNPPSCTSGRMVIYVYKLGGSSDPHIRFLYAVLSPASHRITDRSVQKYDASLLNWIIPPKKDPAIGVFTSLSNDDPELNPSTAINFDLTSLEAGEVYEMTIILQSNSGSFANVGRFEIRDVNGHQIGYQGLRPRDRLHLYLVEGIVFSTVLLALSGIVIVGATWKGKRFFQPIRRALRL